MNRLSLIGAPIAALILPLAATAATASADDDTATAKVWSHDGTLKKCLGHPYKYAVDAPTGPGDSWSLETHLVNRNGRDVAFDFKVMGADPGRGHGTLRFCAENLRPGTYKVRSELITSHYHDETHRWAKQRTIQLRRP